MTDSQGRNLTIALFNETNDGRTDIKPIWSLKDWKEVYLEFCDPTEYEVAMYLLGDWKHWKQIADRSAVSPFIAEWRTELRVKIKSMAIARLKAMAKGEKGIAAARYLADLGFETGKQKKQEVEETILESAEEKSIMANAERLKDAIKSGV